jgi:hypothetical protein
MSKTLELAITKAASLPEETQEALGRELLEKIDDLQALKSEIEAGLRELESGLGEELDAGELLLSIHAERAFRR